MWNCYPGHDSTWNFDPGSQFNVGFWSVYISNIHEIATHQVSKFNRKIKIQQLRRVILSNSTKNPLNFYPSSVFNWGQNFLTLLYTFGPKILKISTKMCWRSNDQGQNLKELGRFIVQTCSTYKNERCNHRILSEINIYCQYIILAIWNMTPFVRWRQFL